MANTSAKSTRGATLTLPPLADSLVEYLRTCKASHQAFSPDVVATICVHGAIYDVETPRGLEEELLRTSDGYDVRVNAATATADGFVIDFQQGAKSGDNYRELIWARVEGGKIKTMLWYCSGVLHR